ncbi:MULTISPECIES: hypothetical protein [Sphingomonas]|jgi:hypothetical protein|uniref:Uncharacterized protein n=1 Tax=Sphingomonas longa TaxID=2778730 RepID=A0ABS2D1G9_9SPHN|nr:MULTISPECIES: hypothetical protein [Alphaproteobacteria]KQR81256.1 hypothetical protein ASG07_12425 [Sphingomonas sp. Leaf343]MBM6574761.1 hypothetical protein [Sphingomonas sp. BT552]MBR7707813.1 hypothetical protein [Microvirga sp. SRT01]
MVDPFVTVTLSLSALAGTGMVVLGGLAGWRGWLALKASELDRMPGDAPVPTAGARIEIADLRERIKKLEAIAAGVDL